MIVHQDELEDYLTNGITLFERSVTGAMLEHCELLAYSSITCPACDGGILPDGEWCSKCRGLGSIAWRRSHDRDAPVTARPTTTGQHSTRSGVEDERLTRYAFVSRAISKLSQASRLAILTAYGEDGAWCVACYRYDRSWALAPLTEPGKRLLAGKDHGGQERLLERLSAIAMDDAAQSKPSRAGQLLAARTQAKRWLEDAEREWTGLFEERRHDAG
jgi:hypothetical protein